MAFLENRSEHTRRAHEYVIKDFFDYIMDSEHESISAASVQGYVNYLNDKNSSKTIRQRFAIVKSLIKHLGLPIDVSNVSLPRIPQKPQSVLDSEQLERYFHEVSRIRKSERLKTLLTILPLTGVRIAEACGDTGLPGITRHDIIKQDGEFLVRVTGKGLKTRDIPLAPLARSALTQYLRHTDEERLFNLNHNTPRRKLRDIGHRIGAPWLTPHTLRHTFITDLVEKGVPLHVVRELAGHSSPTTTLHYCHASFESKVQAVGKLKHSGEGEK